MSETVLANEDSARTPTGEIKDQSPPPTETPKPETTEAKPAEEEKSVLNKEEPKEAKAAEGPPEKYEFKLPEGFELDETVATEVSALFKDLGLSQAHAQRLVDFYSKQSQQAAEAPFKLWADTQKKWVDEIKADPQIGGKLSEVRSTVARAIDGLGDTKLAADFREAMDITGAGNNPAFIRAFFKLAQQVTEGGHVAGNGPSPKGQVGPADRPASPGRALYPNLT